MRVIIETHSKTWNVTDNVSEIIFQSRMKNRNRLLTVRGVKFIDWDGCDDVGSDYFEITKHSESKVREMLQIISEDENKCAFFSCRTK